MLSKLRGAALTASVCIAIASGAIAGEGDSCDTERGRRAFVKCLACHTAKPGAAHLSGPNLWGIMGQPAGSVPGYTYSDAVAKSGVVWDADSLNEYLANPGGFLPGTRMAMAPVRDPEERAGLACYLSTLAGPAETG